MSSLLRGLSLAAASGGYSPAAVHRLLTAVASLVPEHGLEGLQAAAGVACGLRSVAPRLQSTGVVLLQHVGSSWPGDQTCVSCTGRQVLHH